MKNPVYAICKQQRCRSACTFVVHCLVRLISIVSITNNSKLSANLCCYAGWFHSCLVKNPEDRFSHYKIRMLFFQDINFNPIAVTLNLVQKTHTVGFHEFLCVRSNDHSAVFLCRVYKLLKGGSTLYEIYIGFCPHIDLHNIMQIVCLKYDYSICDIVFLIPIYMVKKRESYVIGYLIIGVPSV